VPVPVKLATLGVFEALLANEAMADAAPEAPGINVKVNGTGWLVVTVTGKLTPLIENSEGLAPPKVTEDTVTLAPLAVRVPVAVPLVPTTVLPTAMLGLTLRVPMGAGVGVGVGVGAGVGVGVPVVPVPVRGTVSATPETNRLPPTVPAEWGVKLTINVTLCPAFRVKGNEAPLTENPLPVVWAAPRVSFQERSFVSMTGTVELDPIATGPNGTVEGLAIRDSLLTPPPRTSSTRLAFEALLENWTVPTVDPAVAVKLTFKSTLCPAGRTSGRPKLETANWELLIAIPETVTLVCPLLVRVTSKVSV